MVYDRGMTLGEKLLKLSIEYQQSIENRRFDMGAPAGRDPSVIAADYEDALRELLA